MMHLLYSDKFVGIKWERLIQQEKTGTQQVGECHKLSVVGYAANAITILRVATVLKNPAKS